MQALAAYRQRFQPSEQSQAPYSMACVNVICADTDAEMCARYDAANPLALKQLLASGIKLLPFPKDVMEASYKAAMDYYAETSATNPEFKKIYDDYKKFLDEQNLWWRVAENEYAKFMYSRKR